jgi:hypothetical protein
MLAVPPEAAVQPPAAGPLSFDRRSTRQRERSRTGWPVLDSQFAHREVLRIAGRQWNPDRDGHGGDHAVCLRQCDAGRCMIAAPVAGLDALKPTDRRDAQAIEQADRSRAFGSPQAAMNLLDVDRRRKRYLAVLAKRSESFDGRRPAPERIDEHGRVEQDAHI